MTSRPCLIYARVSSKEQEEEGFSIPAQLELLRGFANKEGLSILHEFTEAETAKSSGREQFGKMLQFVKKQKKPVVLLVEKTDRLYRNFKDYVLVEELINDYDLEIRLVKEGEILSKNASSHLKLIHGIKVLMAKNYIDNLSEEVKKGLLQKAKSGGWIGVAPYGYKMVNKELMVDPLRADFVRTAFQLYGTGLYSIRRCAEELFNSGMIYKTKDPVIGTSKLEWMLKNPIYVGMVKFKKEVYPGKHEPLVDQDLWQKVQQAFRKDAKPLSYQKHEFLYRGLLTCGECGSVLSGELKKGGKYTYYRCSRLKQGCSQGYINEKKITDVIQGTMDRIEFPEELQEVILQATKEMEKAKEFTDKEYTRNLEFKIRTNKQRLRQAYHDKLAGTITEEMWLEVSQEFTQENEDLQEQLGRIMDADLSYYSLAKNLIELPKRAARVWSHGSFEEKVEMLEIITSNLSVESGKVDVELDPLFAYLHENRDLIKNSPDWTDFELFLRLHSETIMSTCAALAA